MREFVAVRSVVSLRANPSLKREALIFHRIAIPLIEHVLLTTPTAIAEAANETEWLLNTGIVFQPEWPLNDLDLQSNKEYQAYSREERELLPKFLDILKTVPRYNESESWEHLLLYADCLSRLTSVQLREKKNLDAHSLLSSDKHSIPFTNASKTDVLEIVLNALPTPDDAVSWEQISDYRDDPDTKGKFLALRNWMNKIVRKNLTSNEIEEELELLIHQYQEHMEYHKMKVNFEIFRTIILANADFVPNLVKLKWGNIAKSLFTLKHRKIALMEAELKAPGREIAYILKARQVFP
jgi:hypothetical protein